MTGGGDSAEYRACEIIGGTDRIVIYRLDRAGSFCTQITLQRPLSSCPLGVTNGTWCLGQANISADIASCENRQLATNFSAATAATGSIDVSGTTTTPVAALDVTLTFPGTGGLPSSVHARLSGCSVTCSATDCRL